MTLRLIVEETYRRGLKALPPDRCKAANAAFVKFLNDPSLPSLKFRPLKGRPGHFIINPNRGDRVILRRDDDDLYAAHRCRPAR